MRPDRLQYSEAGQIGRDLQKRWPAITGQARGPRLSEEQWADVVAFVSRKASETIAARPEPEA